MLQLSCPHCRQRIKVALTSHGMVVRCPTCKKHIKVSSTPASLPSKSPENHRASQVISAENQGQTDPAESKKLRASSQSVQSERSIIRPKPEKVEPVFDAFISYSAKDKELADAVVEELERGELRCWIAPRNLLAGKEWSGGIVEGIERSRVFVLIYSENSNHSQQVLREVERAVHNRVPVIPFRIEDVPMTKEMEFFLSAPHWFDAYTPPLDQHLAKLSTTVHAILDNSSPQVEEGPRNLGEAFKRALRSLLARDSRLRLLVGLALFLLIVGIAIVWSIQSLRDPAVPEELVRSKTDAEVMNQQLESLARGDGFGPKLDELSRHFKSGLTHFDRHDFAGAGEEFATFTREGEHLLELNKLRKSALLLREGVAAARTAVEELAADKPETPTLVEAKRQDEQASNALQQGDFQTANVAWKKATKLYTDARNELTDSNVVEAARDNLEQELKSPYYRAVWKDDPQAKADIETLIEQAETATKEHRFLLAVDCYNKALQRGQEAALPRLKSLAFWFGHAARYCWLAVGNDFQAAKTSNLALARELHRLGMLSLSDRILAQRKILEEQCLPMLGLEQEFKGKLSLKQMSSDEETYQSLYAYIFRDIKNHIQARWGVTVARSYLLGNNLATLKTTLTTAVNRKTTPTKAEVLLSIQFCIDVAYDAGCPQEVLDGFERGRTVYNEALETVPSTKELEPGVYQNVEREVFSPLRYLLEGPDSAATFFRAPTAVHPGRTEQMAALQALRALDACCRYFDSRGNLVQLDFMQSVSDPDQRLQCLQDLTTIQRLDLTGIELTDEGMSHLKDLNDLRELRLDGKWKSEGGHRHWAGPRISAKGLSYLQGLKRLESLELFLNQFRIPEEVLVQVGQLSSLRVLRLPSGMIDQEKKLKQSLPDTQIDFCDISMK